MSTSFWTAAVSKARGTARWAKPMVTAWVPLKRSPVRNSFMPWWTPSLRRQTTEMTAGMTPMRTSLKLHCASSAIRTMSAAPTKPKPPANAAPLTAAMTGLGLSRMAFNTSV